MSEIKIYEGIKPYIFISYARKDSKEIISIIETMMASGYRVWYDKGIQGATEWSEFIAEKLLKSSYFIAFISQNSLNSENCKDELNLARDNCPNKLLIYLENVELSPGMGMRMNRLQAINKFECPDDGLFYSSLFSSVNINICAEEKEVPQEEHEIVVEPPQPTANAISQDIGKNDKTDRANSEKTPTKPHMNAPSSSKKKWMIFGGLGVVLIAGIIFVVQLMMAESAFQTLQAKTSDNPLDTYEELFVGQNITVQDAASMNRLRNDSFRFVNCSFEDNAYEAFINSAQVTSLTLEDTNISISAVNVDSSEVKELSIIGVETSIKYPVLHAIPGCSELESLSVVQNPDAGEVLSSTEVMDTLSNHAALTGLMLNGFENPLGDEWFNENFHGLRSLNLDDNNLTDLKGVEQLIYLENVSFVNNQITDIEELENCTLLTTVRLSGNDIEDFSSLDNSVASIQMLALSDMDLSDSKVLSKFENLTHLDVSDNSLTDLVGIASNKLIYIDASNNNLTDANKLSELEFEQLGYCDLSNNSLSEEGLPRINLYGDYFVTSVNHVDGTETVTARNFLLNDNNFKALPEITSSYGAIDIDVSGNPLATFPADVEYSVDPLIIDYAEAIDWVGMSENYHINNIIINDVPLDKVVELEELFGSNATINKSEA